MFVVRYLDQLLDEVKRRLRSRDAANAFPAFCFIQLGPRQSGKYDMDGRVTGRKV